MQKIVIAIIGQIRCFKYCYNSLFKLIQLLNGDYDIHIVTMITYDNNIQNWKTDNIRIFLEELYESSKITDNEFDNMICDLTENYHKLTYEKQNGSTFYIQSCNKLKTIEYIKHNIHDIHKIIFTRPDYYYDDIFLFRQLIMSDVELYQKSDTIYIINGDIINNMIICYNDIKNNFEYHVNIYKNKLIEKNILKDSEMARHYIFNYCIDKNINNVFMGYIFKNDHEIIKQMINDNKCMKKIFCSGSCRLLTSIMDGRNKVLPIHSLFRNFIGCNFLGKLHNTKQHIQFIKWLNDEIILPKDILEDFLTAYSNTFKNDKSEIHTIYQNNPDQNKQNIQKYFSKCDVYIFEICSIKIQMRNDYCVMSELTNNHTTIIQTKDELLQDLLILRNMIPNKKIIFQCHFRPNIIYNDETLKIEQREIIYNTLIEFSKIENNIHVHDPSIIIEKDKKTFDNDVHWTEKGYLENFKYLYDIINKSN